MAFMDHLLNQFRNKTGSGIGVGIGTGASTPKRKPKRKSSGTGVGVGTGATANRPIVGAGVGTGGSTGSGGSSRNAPPPVRTVSGSSGGGGGGGSSSGGSGYSSSGGRSGGSSFSRSSGYGRSSGSGGSGYSSLAKKQFGFEKEQAKQAQENWEKQFGLDRKRFQEDKRRYEDQIKREEERRRKELARGKTEARGNRDMSLELINAALNHARQNYQGGVADWEQRGRETTAELNAIYGGLTDDATSMQEAAMSNLGAHRDASTNQAQSLIDAIAGRNQQTTDALSQTLEGMGMDKFLGGQQTRASEAMGLAEILAQGQKQRTGADFGLQQNAQQAIGDWNIQGIGTDLGRGTQDVNRQVNNALMELQNHLNQMVQQGQLDRMQAQREYDTQLKALLQLE